MFWLDMILALVLAILVIAILAPTARYRGTDGRSIWLFFLPLLFLLIWASAVWLAPIGAPVAGVYWVNFLLPALFLLFLLFALAAAAVPPEDENDPVAAAERGDAATGVAVVFSIFFWALLVMAAIAVIISYT